MSSVASPLLMMHVHMCFSYTAYCCTLHDIHLSRATLRHHYLKLLETLAKFKRLKAITYTCAWYLMLFVFIFVGLYWLFCYLEFVSEWVVLSVCGNVIALSNLHCAGYFVTSCLQHAFQRGILKTVVKKGKWKMLGREHVCCLIYNSGWQYVAWNLDFRNGYCNDMEHEVMFCVYLLYLFVSLLGAG